MGSNIGELGNVWANDISKAAGSEQKTDPRALVDEFRGTTKFLGEASLKEYYSIFKTLSDKYKSSSPDESNNVQGCFDLSQNLMNVAADKLKTIMGSKEFEAFAATVK